MYALGANKIEFASLRIDVPVSRVVIYLLLQVQIYVKLLPFVYVAMSQSVLRKLCWSVTIEYKTINLFEKNNVQHRQAIFEKINCFSKERSFIGSNVKNSETTYSTIELNREKVIKCKVC